MSADHTTNLTHQSRRILNQQSTASGVKQINANAFSPTPTENHRRIQFVPPHTCHDVGARLPLVDDQGHDCVLFCPLAARLPPALPGQVLVRPYLRCFRAASDEPQLHEPCPVYAFAVELFRTADVLLLALATVYPLLFPLLVVLESRESLRVLHQSAL